MFTMIFWINKKKQNQLFKFIISLEQQISRAFCPKEIQLIGHINYMELLKLLMIQYQGTESNNSPKDIMNPFRKSQLTLKEYDGVMKCLKII